MLGGPIKVRSMSLHVCLCMCVCFYAHVLTCVSVFMHASNTLHSLAYVHNVCVCVCLFMCVCVCMCVCFHRCHLFVSGSGHIHVLISVPSGQIQLSCLLKWDNIPNAKPRTTISICIFRDPQPKVLVQKIK